MITQTCTTLGKDLDTKVNPFQEKGKEKPSMEEPKDPVLHRVESKVLWAGIQKDVQYVSISICPSVLMQQQVQVVREEDMSASKQIVSSLMLSAQRMQMRCLNRPTDRSGHLKVSPRAMQSSSSSFVAQLG